VSLSESQRQLVEMYARDPNPTRIAKQLGIHRSTVYRRLDEDGVREAIAELRDELEPDSERSTRIERTQDMAMELIEMQLQEQLKAAHKQVDEGGNVGGSIADIQKLMAIAEKLGAMRKNVKEAAKEALEKARQVGGEVDWSKDIFEDEDEDG
jgi:DNA invertase Pin-like site-specific DNA recombinase